MAAAQPASGSAEKKATDSLRRVSRAEVAKHNKEGDLWIVRAFPDRLAGQRAVVGSLHSRLTAQIVDSDVYNLSTFASAHPGGETVLLDANIAGKDSTKAFFSLHRSAVSVVDRVASTDPSGLTSTSGCGSRASRRRSRV